MKKFRVWYIPQIPGKQYTILVNTLEEGIVALSSIIGLSIFEFENNIKPDYSDASGMEYFYTDKDTLEYTDKEDITEIDGIKGVWQEWFNEEGESIDELINY